jgi:hypothetical protein
MRGIAQRMRRRHHETPTLISIIADTSRSGNLGIKLIESKGQLGKYAALSHCWGKKQLLTSTKANLELRKAGIDWKTLLKTFQDAITSSHALGLSYVWIDSLCIVQDDSTDWAAEAGQMKNVYSNAHITIAATLSDSVQKGCYSPRDNRSVEVWTSGPADGDDAQFSSVYARIEIDHHSMEEYPLCTRGWTLQEHMLSRRVLNFTPSELRWECRETCTCECTPGPMSESLLFYSPGSSFGYAPCQLKNSPMPEKAWRDIVEEFSKRALTVPSDKLPAMSGLAGASCELELGASLAGLWRNDIVTQLLWATKREGLELNQHSKQYRAPSWSSASMEGPVEYPPFYMACARPETVACRILGAKTTLSTVDPFGAVSAGYIKLEGMAMQATLRIQSAVKTITKLPGDRPHTSWSDATFTRDPDPMQHSFDADDIVKASVFSKLSRKLKTQSVLGKFKMGTPVLVVQLLVGRAEGYRIAHGDTDFSVALVLKKSAKIPGAYERIGIIAVKSNWNWFLDNESHAQAMEVTIV